VPTSRDSWTVLYAMMLALAFVGYPFLSSALGAFDAYARVFSIVYRAFVVFGSFALLRFAVARMPAEAWQGTVSVAFCVLWAMLLARFTWDSSFVPIPMPLPWFDYFLLIVGVVIVPTVALVHAPSERAFDIARRLMLCGGVAAGMFLVAAVLRIVFESDSIAALRRLGTEELNPITLGNIGVVVVIVALLARPLERPSSRIARILDSRTVRVPAGVLGAFLAIASASKGPIIALVGVVLLSQFARLLQVRHGRALFVALVRLTLVFVGMIGLAVALALFVNVRVIDRFVDFAIDSSTSDRVGMMTRALQQFESSPWLGSGFVETQSRFYPHNLFVEALMAIGIPGFCALLVVLWVVFRAGARVLTTRHDWVALLFGQHFIGTMFSGSAYFSSQLWGAAAALLAIDRLLAHQRPQPTPTYFSAPALAIGRHPQ
jgi:O-antigen ligase